MERSGNPRQKPFHRECFYVTGTRLFLTLSSSLSRGVETLMIEIASPRLKDFYNNLYGAPHESFTP
jgi:hypothetical protein